MTGLDIGIYNKHKYRIMKFGFWYWLLYNYKQEYKVRPLGLADFRADEDSIKKMKCHYSVYK